MSYHDQPSAFELTSDEMGPRTIADKAREVLQAVSLGLSPQDESRLEVIESAEGGGADLSDLEDAVEFRGADAVREFADDDLGHECPRCELVVTRWCPTDNEPVCRDCLGQAEDNYEDAQDAARPSWCGPTCRWCEGNGSCEVVSSQRVAS